MAAVESKKEEKAPEPMDASGANANGSNEATDKVEAHTGVLHKGFRLLLDQYVTLLDVGVTTPMPDDIVEKMRRVLDDEDAKRRAAKAKDKGAAMDTGTASGKRKGEWDHARTAALVARAVSLSVEGVKKADDGVEIEKGVPLKGVIDKPPHVVLGTNYVRCQAVEYDDKRTLAGPFDKKLVEHPVYMGCRLEWFQLPKEVQLDFGKVEPKPGLTVDIGDPSRCGCEPEAAKVWQRRPMFYKVLELLAVEIDRLGSLFSVLVEETRAVLTQDGAEDVKELKKRMETVVDDLDDICTIQCSRSAALLYLMCQNSREVALASSGLTGFTKNWLRLAHASRILFEPGKTDKQNILKKQGTAKMPPKREMGGGGGRGGGGGGRGGGGGSRGGGGPAAKRFRGGGRGGGGGGSGGSGSGPWGGRY